MQKVLAEKDAELKELMNEGTFLLTGYVIFDVQVKNSPG